MLVQQQQLLLLQLAGCTARLCRRECIISAAAAAVTTAAPQQLAWANSGPIFFQSNDGAFELELPVGWKVLARCAPSGRDPQCTLSGRRESVLAYRAGNEAVLEANVDLGAYGMRLADFESLEEVVRDLQAVLPPSVRLLDAQAETNGRSSKQSRYYVVRFVGATGGERLVKMSVQQSRLYTLSLQTDVTPSPALRAELDAIARKYQVFPVSSMRGGLLRSTAPARILPPSLRLPP